MIYELFSTFDKHSKKCIGFGVFFLTFSLKIASIANDTQYLGQ